MSPGIAVTRRPAPVNISGAFLAAPIRVLHALISAPEILFLATLTAMLFRPPDLKSVPWDRIALIVLICASAVRWFLDRRPLPVYRTSWPLFALLILGLANVLASPHDCQAWSLFAARWFVPFALFHVAALIFRDENAIHKLEVFCVAVLAYLSSTAVFFLFDAKSLIFPRFILDEGIGIHADRARGPFLQAVANGVSVNLLGLIAVDCFRRRRVPRFVAAILFLAVPLALLATKTRAVWLSAGFSVVYLAAFSQSERVKKAARALCILAALVVGGAVVYQLNSSTLVDRFADRSPVDFRLGMYRAGWQMFLERPLLGWNNEAELQAEVGRRASGFHPEYYVFHNTYLELAVRNGLLGVALYTWLIVCLFRVEKASRAGHQIFGDSGFRELWPLMLGVYLLNASAVVMNYQFVNGLLFAFAGILAAQNSRLDLSTAGG